MSRWTVLTDAGLRSWRAGGTPRLAALAAVATVTVLSACHGKNSAAPPAGAANDGSARLEADAAGVAGGTPVRDASAESPPVDPLQQARITEVQHIIADGAAPERLARFIAACTGQAACQVARRMALGALRTVADRPARLQALIEAARAPGTNPDDDPLWPDLVQALSETWATPNNARGRTLMLQETDRRVRLLLVSSLAVYAASNRGLSDLTMPQRRALRAAFTRLYPSLPPPARAQVDAFVARIDVNARGTL